MDTGISYSVSGVEKRGVIVALHGVSDNAASLSDLAAHWNREWKVVLCVEALVLEDPALLTDAQWDSYHDSAQGKIQVDRNLVSTGVVGVRGRELIAKLVVPTLLVTGDGNDVLWGEPGCVAVKRLGNPRLRTVVLEGATHTVRHDRAEGFYLAVERFLGSLDEAL